jgi:hypothetical protein
MSAIAMAKRIWMDPQLEMAQNYGLSEKLL